MRNTLFSTFFAPMVYLVTHICLIVKLKIKNLHCNCRILLQETILTNLFYFFHLKQTTKPNLSTPCHYSIHTTLSFLLSHFLGNTGTCKCIELLPVPFRCVQVQVVDNYRPRGMLANSICIYPYGRQVQSKEFVTGSARFAYVPRIIPTELK